MSPCKDGFGCHMTYITRACKHSDEDVAPAQRSLLRCKRGIDKGNVASNYASRKGTLKQKRWPPPPPVWRGVQDTRGAWWLYSPNVDSHGRLPAEVEWARVYNYRPPAYTCGFFDGAGTSANHGVCTVWGWKAVRGSLPRDSEAMRVKDALDSGCRPSQPVMENRDLCVSY